MKASWLLEKDVFFESFIDDLSSALIERKQPFYWVDYAPFGAGMDIPAPGSDYVKPIQSNDCVVVYGSINLVRRLIQGNPWFKNAWTPTAWMNLENLSCRAYYSHWQDLMLFRSSVFTTWRILKEMVFWYYSMFSADGCIFVKPDQNLKLFSGKVVHKDDFEKFHKMETDCYSVPDETLIVVSIPQFIKAEWRFVICDRKVVTGSQYRRDQKPKLSSKIEDGAMEVAILAAKHEWQPDVAYVVDVVNDGQDYGVLEIGSVNSAGMYNCNAGAIVDALSGLAEKEYAEIYDAPSTIPDVRLL